MKKYGYLLVIMAFLLISCTNLTVLHLKKNKLEFNLPQVLLMNYLEFHYISSQKGNKLFIKGRAYPRKDKIPPWGDFVKELWLGTYLSDPRGKVIAQDIKIYPPNKIGENGFPFEFTLKPKDFGTPGPLYITFGYRLKIVAYPSDKNSKPRVFFAIEKAENF